MPAWRLSNSMDAEFCGGARRNALAHFGKPEIFNTDQGSLFTSADVTTDEFAQRHREPRDRGQLSIDNLPRKIRDRSA